jgi:hypothetical protein
MPEKLLGKVFGISPELSSNPIEMFFEEKL